MGALRMDSAELNNLGNTIISNADNLDSLISSYRSAYESLTSPETWSGEDASKFNEAAAKFRSDLESASNIIREVGTDLVRTATYYDETESSVSSNIGSMF